MIKTLRESKAKLSELVESASRGEEVLITVRGRVKARLSRAATGAGMTDRAAWVRELRALHKSHSKAGTRLRIEDILAQSREDRV